MAYITIAFIGVIALWTISGVRSLQCYSCTQMKNNTLCNLQPAVTCNSSSFCFTEVDKAAFQDVKISKRCVSEKECNPTNYNLMVASRHTSCCTGDFCNEYANGTINITCNFFLIVATVLMLGVLKNFA